MIALARRYRKALTVSLLMVSLSGGRVYALTDACQQTRVFFGPSLAFKMVARSVGFAAERSPWKRPAPRSFGASRNRFSADDVAAVRFSSALAPVAIVPGAVITLAALPRCAPAQTLVPRTCDAGPTPPLHTRK